MEDFGKGLPTQRTHPKEECFMVAVLFRIFYNTLTFKIQLRNLVTANKSYYDKSCNLVMNQYFLGHLHTAMPKWLQSSLFIYKCFCFNVIQIWSFSGRVDTIFSNQIWVTVLCSKFHTYLIYGHASWPRALQCSVDLCFLSRLRVRFEDNILALTLSFTLQDASL